MGQVTIYLDDAIEAKLRLAAKQENISRSRWVSRLIEERLAGEWPPEVRALAGSWADFPDLTELRGPLSEDQRESL